jgi:hypothetical protein
MFCLTADFIDCLFRSCCPSPRAVSCARFQGDTMKTIRAAVALALLLVVGGPWSPSSITYAESSKGPRSSRSTKGTSSRKTVHVRTYTRKNGTVVSAHTRSAPHSRSTSGTPTRSRVISRSHPSPNVTGGRTRNGRIARSEEAKRQFMRQTGYPRGRPGYVIDHVRPLACGGADSPSNMQWQTLSDAKAKDKVERVGCK